MLIGETQFLDPGSLDLHSAIDQQLDVITEGERLAKQSYRSANWQKVPPHLERVILAKRRLAELEELIPREREADE